MDDLSIIPHIADLIEAPDPRAIVQQLAKELDELQRMSDKARALLDPETPDPDHGIFARLAERVTFRTYARSTLHALLNQADLPASLIADIQALMARVDTVDTHLYETCKLYFTGITRSTIPPSARAQHTLQELHDSLQKAAHALTIQLHNASIVATLSPIPATAEDLVRARTELRHNRAEMAVAATQLAARATKAHAISPLYISAKAFVIAIASTLDAMERAYDRIEDALDGTTKPPPSVH